MLSNKEKDILTAIEGYFGRQEAYANTKNETIELEGYSADEISQTIQKVFQQLDVLEPVRVENRNLESKLETALQYIDMLQERYEWRDVKYCLPKESGWYWVTHRFDFKGEFAYQDETDYKVDKEWFDKTKNKFEFTHQYVIAWKPYEPDPYERKE